MPRKSGSHFCEIAGSFELTKESLPYCDIRLTLDLTFGLNLAPASRQSASGSPGPRQRAKGAVAKQEIDRPRRTAIEMGETPMLGLMQNWPLLCHRIIDHAALNNGERPVISRSLEGPMNTTNNATIRSRDRKSTRLNSSHEIPSRMPSSA